MSEILFSFPGSTAEGAPNGGRGFNYTLTVPPGMRVPCLGEDVVIPIPDSDERCSLRVHYVDHIYAFEKDYPGQPYTYIVLRYGR